MLAALEGLYALPAFRRADARYVAARRHVAFVPLLIECPDDVTFAPPLFSVLAIRVAWAEDVHISATR